jgi:glucose-6-phosphate 1-dehydrogenase
MTIQLYIDSELTEEWYIDKNQVFKNYAHLSHRENIELHKKIVDEFILEKKQLFWRDLESAKEWAFVLNVHSKINRSMDNYQMGRMGMDIISKKSIL